MGKIDKITLLPENKAILDKVFISLMYSSHLSEALKFLVNSESESELTTRLASVMRWYHDLGQTLDDLETEVTKNGS